VFLHIINIDINHIISYHLHQRGKSG